MSASKRSDDRRDAYRQISALCREAQDVEIVQPLSVWERTSVRKADGREHKLLTYRLHLLCDDKGEYPAELNAWERDVLKAELKARFSRLVSESQPPDAGLSWCGPYEFWRDQDGAP